MSGIFTAEDTESTEGGIVGECLNWGLVEKVRSLLQVFGWDGADQEGVDATQEGGGAVAGFAGVLVVDYFSDPVICNLPQDRELADLRSPFRFDKARSHDMHSKHSPHPGVGACADSI